MQVKPKNPLPTLILNVPDIANKSAEHVTRFLGPASSSNMVPGQDTTKNTYHQGDVEVQFKKDRAHRITIRNTKELPFEAGALRKLGLPMAKARTTPGGALKWDRLCGIADVTMYPGTRSPVSHVFIAVAPPSERRISRTSRGWLTLTSA